MPSLNWIGKDAVLNHHRDVPYRLLKCEGDLSNGDPGSGNLLIEGDNLEALKALLPYYKGKVKCIYIDPPYNTGNEGWAYNDNVNSPQMKKWLGEVVGFDKLDRHDRWLCMMLPRLQLLREFLSEDGVLFVSIDTNESSRLEHLLDMVMGEQNKVATFIWRKVDSPNDNKVVIAADHEYIFCYARRLDSVTLHRRHDASILNAYPITAEDGRQCRDRLLRKNGRNSRRSDRPTMWFPLENPDGLPTYPLWDNGIEGCWAMSSNAIQKAKEDGRLIWKKRTGPAGEAWVPYVREFAPSVPLKPHPTIWADLPTMRQAKAQLNQLNATYDIPVFDTPKPEQLLQRILEMGTNPGDLVLDSFLGSGTTAAVAYKLGRRFIGVDFPDLIRPYSRPRLAVVTSDKPDFGVPSALGFPVPGFRYCTLGETLFTADGMISGEVTRERLAHHVWFTETGEPLPHAVPEGALIGEHNGKPIALIEGPLTVRSLRDLPPSANGMIVYADACRVDTERLASLGIVFKAIPYDVRDA